MSRLPYTLYISETDPSNDYMYTLATNEVKARKQTGAPVMFAPLVQNGVTHAFTLLKKNSPAVSEPVRKRDIVDILGADGDVDLLENLLQRPIYKRRTITETFMLLCQNSESGHYRPAKKDSWSALISGVKNYLNFIIGPVRIVLSEDRSYYYTGRISAAVDELEAYRAILTVTAEVEPYKTERYNSTEPWIWDDFSFIDGIIREYIDIPISHETDGYMEFNIPVRTKDCVPKFRHETGSSDTESDVQVRVAGDEAWHNAAFASYTPIDGVVLKGSHIYGTERTLQIKGNGHKICIQMRGETL